MSVPAVGDRPCILFAEDDPTTLKVIAKTFPVLLKGFDLVFVTDAENAAKALLGQSYTQFNPLTRETSTCSKRTFQVVVWDNNMPPEAGTGAEDDVGIKAVSALRVSTKLGEASKIRFISSSSDPVEKLERSGLFDRILPKPLKAVQLSAVLKEWSLCE